MIGKTLVVRFVAVLFLFLSLSGCASNVSLSNPPKLPSSIEDLTFDATEEDKKLLSSVPEGNWCSQKTAIRAELGVPGSVSGFDCIDSAGSIQIVFREYEALESGLISLSRWVFGENAGYYLSFGEGWFGIFNDDFAQGASNVLSGNVYEFSGLYEFVKESQAKDCAEIVGATILDVVYQGNEFPEGFSTEVAEMIRRDYASLTGLSDRYAIDDGELHDLLGNHAINVNRWCERNGNPFDE